MVGGALTGVGIPVVLAIAADPWWPDRTGAAVLGAVATAIALVADRLGIAALAVRRQVPQWWGHRHGPWLGAARYAPRLGLGPATILTSWVWWAGLVVGLDGPASATAFGISYVLVRSSTTVLLGSGVGDGVAMATRLRTVQAARPTVDRMAVAAAGATALALIVWSAA